jgi:hypothetical protein
MIHTTNSNNYDTWVIVKTINMGQMRVSFMKIILRGVSECDYKFGFYAPVRGIKLHQLCCLIVLRFLQ